jgi:hypothetical protein
MDSDCSFVELTSLQETIKIKNFCFNVTDNSLEQHGKRIHNFLCESGLERIKNGFCFYIKDHKKYMLAKIKYGF